MYTIYNLKHQYQKNPDAFWFTMNTESTNTEEWTCTSKNDGKVYSAKDIVNFIRKEIGQDFTTVYYDHIDLTHVLRCNKCGTVIFSMEDEDYEPNLRCPTCTDYKTGFTFWTKEEIESDPEKQEDINEYERIYKYMLEYDERKRRRNGKSDNQLFLKDIRTKKREFHIELGCDSIMNKFPLKGLYLNISIYKKKEDDVLLHFDRRIHIPLSLFDIKVQLDCKRSMKELAEEMRGKEC